MTLNIDRLKEGCILVLTSGLMLQVIRYSLTEIKFRFLCIHSCTKALYALFLRNCNIRKRNSISPEEFIFKSIKAIPREFIYKFKLTSNWSKGWRKADSMLSFLLRATSVVITDKQEIKKIKALSKKVISDFAVAKLYYGYAVDSKTGKARYGLHLQCYRHDK